MRHLLITHTFPPRVGGREAHLYQFFTRLNPTEVVVVTPDREGDWRTFDRNAPFPIVRVSPAGPDWFFRGGRKRRLRWFTYMSTPLPTAPSRDGSLRRRLAGWDDGVAA